MSSWLIRLAKAYHQKLHTFCVLRWGRTKQIWTRDIDKFGSVDIENSLSENCSVPIDRVRDTLLRRYEGYLYEHHNPNGNTLFILPLGIFHRTRHGFGIQFCPDCLASDDQPYVRKSWRLAISVVCTKHRRILADRCPKCKRPFVPHRLELGERNNYTARPLYICHNCGFDLRRSPSKTVPPSQLNRLVRATIKHRLAIQRGWIKISPDTIVYSHLYFIALRRLMLLANSPQKKRFRKATLSIAKQLQIKPIRVPPKLYREIENQPILTRVFALTIADWLLEKWPERFLATCQRHRIWETQLVRDFSEPPYWFWKEVHSRLCVVYSPWRTLFGKRKNEFRSYAEFVRKTLNDGSTAIRRCKLIDKHHY